MLILTRKLGENIVIGQNISVKIVNIEHNKVQLGIQAPSTIMIYRQELVEKVSAQNKSSIVNKRNDLICASQFFKKLLV